MRVARHRREAGGEGARTAVSIHTCQLRAHESRTSQERSRWRGSEDCSQHSHLSSREPMRESHVTGEKQVERERGLQSAFTPVK